MGCEGGVPGGVPWGVRERRGETGGTGESRERGEITQLPACRSHRRGGGGAHGADGRGSAQGRGRPSTAVNGRAQSAVRGRERRDEAGPMGCEGGFHGV